MNDQIANPEPFFEPSMPQAGPIEADALFGMAPTSQDEPSYPPVSGFYQSESGLDDYSEFGYAGVSRDDYGRVRVDANDFAYVNEIDDESDEDDYDEEAGEFAFMQNRELSWLTFNERVLDQGADESVPLLERLNFISIFWSNLQEFFMVRVGSLTDLALIEPPVKDSKTGMTPKEQIKAIHERCRELYPIQESYYEHVRGLLAKQGVRHLRPDDLSDEQRNYLAGLVKYNIEPFLSPQIINPRHPFPHLENGKLYILLRLDDETQINTKKKSKKNKKGKKEKGGAEGVVLGLIPLPHQCERVIKLPGRGFQFILLEHAIEMYAAEIFSMYTIKHTNVICVTRNADIDANQTGDEQDEDYREHMKRLLKQRARLAPVRLECERPLSPVMEKLLLKKLGLKRSQVYDTIVPLDLSFTWGLGSRLSDSKREKLSNPPFTPAWPVAFDRKRRIMDQVSEKEVLLSYPYESMDPFVQLLKEAAFDPTVISIKITLYRLASQSQLAEALITAAENGKQVTALFELRARFDESNNIEWSQRFEQAGCNVIYGFRDYKVHSKICCITRRLPDGSLQSITQLGTGNYNEKTAKLYTDLSFITTDPVFAADAAEFFRNMQLENVSDNYRVLRVAPLQIKPMILQNLDHQIALAREGKPCGAFLKANSITDKDVIEKIAEASQAGVGITLFIRGICCIVPEIKGATENVRVVSIVGRLLEHSRIYCFGTPDDCVMYLSSADLMTRNLNKRIEIAWPILNADIRYRILDYINTCLHDTAKLRELRPNKTYTPLGAFYELDEDGNALPPLDAQAALIAKAASRAAEAEAQEQLRQAKIANLPSTLDGAAAAEIAMPTAAVISAAEQFQPVSLPDTESAVAFEPLSMPEPAFTGEPVSAFEPISMPELADTFEPMAMSAQTDVFEPMAMSEPVDVLQPVATPEPVVEAFEPPTIPEPVVDAFEPPAIPEPVVDAFEPTMMPEPAVDILEPTALPEQVEVFQPAFAEEPMPIADSAFEVAPQIAFEAPIAAEPALAVEPAFVAEPAVAFEAPLAVETIPMVEPATEAEPPAIAFEVPFAAEPALAAEPVFAAEPMPAAEPSLPVAQPVTLETPVFETFEQAVPVAEASAPLQSIMPEASAFEQPAPVTQPVTLETPVFEAFEQAAPVAEASVPFQSVMQEAPAFEPVQQLAPEAEPTMTAEPLPAFQEPPYNEPASMFEPTVQQDPIAQPFASMPFDEAPAPSEPVLTDLTIGDILMPEPTPEMGYEGITAQQMPEQIAPMPKTQPYDAAAIPDQSFVQTASIELPVQDFEPQPTTQPQPLAEGLQPSGDQPMRVSFDSAPADQPLRISFDSAAEDQPLRISFDSVGEDAPLRVSFDDSGSDTPLRVSVDDSFYQGSSQAQPQNYGNAPTYGYQSGAPYGQQPPAQAPSNQSFIDEGHRELEMPAEKKGLFSRFRKKK